MHTDFTCSTVHTDFTCSFCVHRLYLFFCAHGLYLFFLCTQTILVLTVHRVAAARDSLNLSADPKDVELWGYNPPVRKIQFWTLGTQSLLAKIFHAAWRCTYPTPHALLRPKKVVRTASLVLICCLREKAAINSQLFNLNIIDKTHHQSILAAPAQGLGLGLRHKDSFYSWLLFLNAVQSVIKHHLRIVLLAVDPALVQA